MSRLQEKMREIFVLFQVALDQPDINARKAGQLEYLAERLKMQKLGAPLLDGQYILTEHGPLATSFAQAAKMLEGSPIPPIGSVKSELNKFERDLLVGVLTEHGGKSEDELTVVLRECCPEWTAKEDRSRGALTRGQIWSAMGFSLERIESLEDRLDEAQGLTAFWDLARKYHGKDVAASLSVQL